MSEIAKNRIKGRRVAAVIQLGPQHGHNKEVAVMLEKKTACEGEWH